MSLKRYREKRRFDRTPEPAGDTRQSLTGKNAQSAQRMFIVQKHDASRLHYDFRLELDGVLKSWAVPKGPSLDPARKALAVQVEDHPMEYAEFEGVIPDGQYGGGTVLLWDRGTWSPLGDPAKGLAAGKLHFELHGQKLHGEWSLVRMAGKAGDDGTNWLLMKIKDTHARKGDEVVESLPKSVKSSRSMDEIAEARDSVWSGEAKRIAEIPGAKKSPWPHEFSPQLAVLADSAPAGDEWLHEIKFDGYRLIAEIRNGQVSLKTRNGHDWTHKFAGVATALEAIKTDTAILDGEVVVLDDDGKSDFQALQAMLKDRRKAAAVYYLFDLPWCDGFDLRQVPLDRRKELLKEIFDRSGFDPIVRYSEHVRGDGSAVAKKACEMQLEGIISKRADAAYTSRRDPSWLKSKCVLRQEFVVIGYTDPQGGRPGFGSLLLGVHEHDGELLYAGRVGTGFDDNLLEDTLTRLKKIEQESAPTAEAPPARERRSEHWVKPQLVAEVKFTGWTRDGRLRHPAFVAFRSDKPAKQVMRERAVDPENVTRAATAPASASAPASATGSASAPAPAPAAPAATRRGSKKPPRPAGATKKSRAASPQSIAVKLTHPDKVFYPDPGTTKRQVADYYAIVAEWMLPHVAHRPLALVRCPGGVGSKCFFQRNWSSTLPAAIGKVDIGEGKKREDHVCIDDAAGLIAMAQIGALEIHTWNCRADDIEHPDQLIFDLDPAPDVAWTRVRKAVRDLRNTIDSLGLPAFLKTSGGKGLHLAIPIRANLEWDVAKGFTQTIAQSLAEKSPEMFIANMRKDLRTGKVYVDYNRNGRGATAVAPYSTRARPGAPLAMPISWEEFGKLKSANHFTVETAGRYLEKRKTDPWRDFERSRVDLHEALNAAG